jgi:hypothetical protein
VGAFLVRARKRYDEIRPRGRDGEDCDNFATNEVTGTNSAYPAVCSRRMPHPRRQQYRHLARSASYAVAAAAILLVALSVSRSGGDPLLVFTLLLAAGLSLAARRSKRLAGRCRAGADSEQAVRFVLNQLVRSGWTVRNGAGWPGGGDVDHLVRSPDGLGFAIETKTMTFSQEHLWRTEATARWAARRFRRYSHG